MELTGEKDIAEAFNKHFATVADNLERDLSPPDDVPPASLIPVQENSFFVFPVTPTECEIIVNGLKNSSYGKNSLSTRLLKEICKFISIPMSLLINESLQVGEFPDELKIETITPIYKKGNPANVANYRPISVLPMMSKIFEKVMTNRLTKYLYKHNIISPHQYGFQKGKSTADAVTTLTDCVYEKLNTKEHSVAVFIDLCKAYDCVNHSILLNKLYQYGIRGVAHNWFRSYLSNRQNCVRIGGTFSDAATINISIPQGSVIGCILFSLCINDLPLISSSMKTVLFTDDTVLVCSDSNYNNLIKNFNAELLKVNGWLLRNRLTLNIESSLTVDKMLT